MAEFTNGGAELIKAAARGRVALWIGVALGGLAFGWAFSQGQLELKPNAHWWFTVAGGLTVVLMLRALLGVHSHNRGLRAVVQQEAPSLYDVELAERHGAESR